jgi:hypothetical protein
VEGAPAAQTQIASTPGLFAASLQHFGGGGKEAAAAAAKVSSTALLPQSIKIFFHF